MLRENQISWMLPGTMRAPKSRTMACTSGSLWISSWAATILAAASKETFFTAFHQGIAVLGKEGTVKNIYKNEKWAENFNVKTGTIEKSKAFAGYFTSKKGELMSFSIIANQFEGSESGMSRELVKLFEDMWKLE